MAGESPIKIRDLALNYGRLFVFAKSKRRWNSGGRCESFVSDDVTTQTTRSCRARCHDPTSRVHVKNLAKLTLDRYVLILTAFAGFM